jgi:hypothetical protein
MLRYDPSNDPFPNPRHEFVLEIRWNESIS